MARKHKKRQRVIYNKDRRKIKPKKKVEIEYVLETTSLKEMAENKKRIDALLEYNWKYYSELEYQRNSAFDNIKEALLKGATKDFIFQNWQRAVKWKYSNHPLSACGSTKFIGQRFNFGEDINLSENPFPGLYIAEDKDTALQETLGQPPKENQFNFTAQELALMNPQSETIVSVSGKLETVIDLRTLKSVAEFVKIIKGFKISKEIKDLAKELGQESPNVLKTKKELIESILEYEWRINPSGFDIPSNSQIFGQLVYNSGIEGIIYPSKLNNKSCLVIFTTNFKNSSSYIEFDDDPPTKSMPKRFDSTNFDLLEKPEL